MSLQISIIDLHYIFERDIKPNEVAVLENEFRNQEPARPVDEHSARVPKTKYETQILINLTFLIDLQFKPIIQV